jgi:hypothetical protein
MSYKIRVFRHTFPDNEEYYTAQIELRPKAFIFGKTIKHKVANPDVAMKDERFQTYDSAYKQAIAVLKRGFPEYYATKQEVTQ